MFSYKRNIYWSEEDQKFIVEVPELPGCMADGATEEEAQANADVVIKEWLETADIIQRNVSESEKILIRA